jgi:hypothetical protein
MSTGIPVREQLPFSRTARTVRTIRTGSSGATVRIMQEFDKRLIAIKTAHQPRVSARQQAKARDAIAPYFGDRLPRVLFAGQRHGLDTLITECPSTCTLADAVAEHDRPRALGAWADFTAALCRVWTESARPGFDPALATRNHKLRWQRGIEGLEFAIRSMELSTASWQHVIVNDTDHGALGSITERLLDPPSPSVHVVCQGDPQPRNVLLDSSNRWHLVDWEWAGFHQDWRMMTSHLVGWWYVERLLHSAHGRVQPTATGVSLFYELPPTTAMSLPISPAADVFQQMTRRGQRDQDLVALICHSAMLLLREIPIAIVAGRHHLFAPLLGEMIRLIGSSRTDTPHPLFSHFAASRQNQKSRA